MTNVKATPTAKDLIHKSVQTVKPNTKLASVFINHRLRHLPVVGNQRLLGIVRRRDVLKELDRYYREAIKMDDEERNPPDIKQIINHRFIMRSP